MRTPKELFEILLNSKSIFKQYYCGGLCSLTGTLEALGTITNDEMSWLLEYIRLNRPKPFTRNYSVFGCRSLFYWRVDVWAPRKRWIKAQIKKLS
jgi:hypothetical protein